MVEDQPVERRVGIAILVAGIVSALTIMTAAAFELPLRKTGQCPTNYYQSGAYCAPIPSAAARPAIPKVGQCPVGWSQSGNYCIAPARR